MTTSTMSAPTSGLSTAACVACVVLVTFLAMRSADTENVFRVPANQKFASKAPPVAQSGGSGPLAPAHQEIASNDAPVVQSVGTEPLAVDQHSPMASAVVEQSTVEGAQMSGSNSAQEDHSQTDAKKTPSSQLRQHKLPRAFPSPNLADFPSHPNGFYAGGVQDPPDDMATQEFRVSNPEKISSDKWSASVDNATKRQWSLDEFGNLYATPKIHVPHHIVHSLRRPCGSCDCSFRSEQRIPAKCNVEANDRMLTARYLPQNSTVLELGARYGSNSCAISIMQRNSGRLVAVEADKRVQKSLRNNKKLHHCKFEIVNGFLGRKDGKIIQRGFSTSTYIEGAKLDAKQWANSNVGKMKQLQKEAENHHFVEKASKIIIVPHVTLDTIQERFNMKFDTMILDCEGCAPYVFGDFPELMVQLKLIIMEVHDELEQAFVRKCRQDGWKLLYSNKGGWRVVLQKPE